MKHLKLNRYCFRYHMPQEQMPMLYSICSGTKPGNRCYTKNVLDLIFRIALGILYLVSSVLVTFQKVKQRRNEQRRVVDISIVDTSGERGRHQNTRFVNLNLVFHWVDTCAFAEPPCDSNRQSVALISNITLIPPRIYPSVHK